jgi:pimeloyl-ACP methyl ester carboxylesterase
MWLRTQPPPPKDISAQFARVYADAVGGKSTLPPDAKAQHYLLVGGLFTNHYPGYMDANQRQLQDLGLQADRLPIDSDAPVAQNAATIRDAVNKAFAADGKKVVLIGQSKGGVDVTAALALYPELKSKVRAVVAMQAPCGGTPIASDLKECPELKAAATGAISDLLNGDPKALTDLTYANRKAFITRHPYPSDVPTISLATSRNSPLSLLDGTAAYMRDRYGLASDGLVPSQEAEIPGSKVVRLDDMDHAESVMSALPGFGTYQPGALTQALVTLALETPAPT